MPAESLTLVVDKNDEPAGVERRDYIQQNGLWHRIIGVWIIDTDGNMLVQRRQLGRGLDDNKLDSSASGHVDPKEDYEEAARREVSEELGVHLGEDQLESIAHFRTQNTAQNKLLNRFTKVFVARVERKAIKLSVDEKELGGVEWLSSDEVADLVTNHPDQTVPGFVIAWYLYNGLSVPQEVIAENSLKVIEPVQAA
jgi:isopentenyldiphosphate isomerase